MQIYYTVTIIAIAGSTFGFDSLIAFDGRVKYDEE